MKAWGWPLLIGFALGALLSWLVRGDPSEEVAGLRSQVAVVREQSRVADSLLAARDSTVVRVSRETARLAADTLRLSALARQATQGHQRASHAARAARSALDSARTMADSLPALVVALGAETRRAEAAEATLGATRDQLAGTARILALKDSTIGIQGEMISALRSDRDRWRTSTDSAMTVIGTLERRRRGLWPSLVSGAETAAIGAATVKACEGSLLSVGCLAGGVVTVVRLAKVAG